MSVFTRRFVLTIVQACVFATLAACQSSAVDTGSSKSASVATADGMVAQQLIIKFKPATFRCNAADIARLSAQSRVQLTFVRPLSGDACVIKQLQAGAGDFSRGQTLLQQHPAIEWVELDGVMKTM